MAMLLKINVPGPRFTTAKVCGELVWPTLVAGKSGRAGGPKIKSGVSPVPLNAILCGELPALSVIVTAAVNAPPVVGAKCP